MKNYPTPEQLYVLELAARRARNAEIGRLVGEGGRALSVALNLERAERFELALDSAIELWSRLKRAVTH